MAKIIIKDLHVTVEDEKILNGVNLVINEGEMIALLGPNGHGKSTLLHAIMGNPKYKVIQGNITMDGKDVLSMSVDERSKAGVFLAMQHPSEIAGVNNSDFLKACLNARSDKPVPLFKFYKELDLAYKAMGIPFELATRNLNEGFSGGEKKRNEILQLKVLKPSVALLDEIDSGLDVDAINVVSEVIKEEKNKGMSFLVISHYARLFNLIKPTRCVVLINGEIVVDGGVEIIDKVDKQGYDWIKTELGIKVQKFITKKPTSIGTCITKEVLK